MSKNKRSWMRILYEKIFTEPNILKVLPVLLAPTFVTLLLGFILLDILPEEVKNIVGYNNYVSLIIGVSVIILTRIYFKNGLYFRITLAVVLLVAVSTLMGRLNYLMGGIVDQYSLGEMLIQTLPSAPLIALMVIYIGKSVQQPLTKLTDEVHRVSEGDLTIEKTDLERYGTEFADFENSFVQMVENISLIIATAQEATEQVSSSSEELASTSEEVNALSEEIAATIQQISRGASNQSEFTARGITSINKMSDIVDQSLQDIENILQVIDDIAGQTNILALNAAIEAARAGEYGRGFAVVADNVRRLAEETKNNAADINKLTEEIIINIGEKVKTLQETLQGFAAQSEEFSASSEEVAAATEEQTAAMHHLTSSAQDLTKLSEKLATVITRFKF
jgi:methyl-accepting chemotaxis protein